MSRFVLAKPWRPARKSISLSSGKEKKSSSNWSRPTKINSPWSDIKGLAYQDRGRPVLTAPKDPIQDIDGLPEPARHLIPLGRYRALGLPISMTTSRGCPFRCIFCVGRKMVGAKVRYRDPQKVVDELAYLSTLGFHQINIADDLFTASKKHCLAVCDEIIPRQLNVRWTSFARVDTVSRRGVGAHEGRPAAHAVSFGVETGKPRNPHHHQKRASPSTR